MEEVDKESWVWSQQTSTQEAVFRDEDRGSLQEIEVLLTFCHLLLQPHENKSRALPSFLSSLFPCLLSFFLVNNPQTCFPSLVLPALSRPGFLSSLSLFSSSFPFLPSYTKYPQWILSKYTAIFICFASPLSPLLYFSFLAAGCFCPLLSRFSLSPLLYSSLL